MNITRRVFMSLLFTAGAQGSPITVAVLEVFENGNSAVGALVHHAEAASRDAFATWLQAHPKSSIRVRTANGEVTSAKMFRVRMCFGRGLVMFEKPVQVRERDVLTIVGDPG